jgi:hypothetical protein
MLAGPMPPPAPARVIVAALLAAAALVAGVAPPVAGLEAIPREGGSVLPGEAHGAIVGDVDGDGVRELVRLVPWSSSPGRLALEVVSMDGGEPRLHGQALVQRAASVEDHVAGNNPDEAELLPLSTSEPARLIAWRDGDRERVLLATMQGDPGSVAIERSCCLTLWWVGFDRDGATALEYVQNTVASAAWIVAADMDADGTDELAVVETPNPAIPAASEVMVLRWNGRDFDRLRATAHRGLISGPLTVLGDSDGLAGEEVGYVATPPPGDFGASTLHRFALANGRMRIDRRELTDRGSIVPLVGPAGPRLAIVSERAVQLLEWPAGEPSRLVDTFERGGTPLGVLGTGESARLLVLRGSTVDLLDAELRSRQGIVAGQAAVWFNASSLPPYHGELPGGDESGEATFVFGGRLISGVDASGQAPFREIAVLAGKTPVGLFGPGRGWAAVGDGPALPAARRGGGLLVGASARASALAVVPADALLTPAADGGRLEPVLSGGLLDDSLPARPSLMTNGEVRATIAAPPNSRLQVTSRDGERTEGLLAAEVADVVLIPAFDSDENEAFTVRLLVSTPAGQGYGATWEARVLRQPPALRASAPFASLAFTVPISGQTAPSVTLEVDGEPVAVQPDGSFAADVGAGLLPRSVRVAATDRLGNTNEVVVEVVALIDYRQLPWVPAVVVLTLAAGAILYLRVPRPTSTGSAHPDEGVLEDIQ